MATAAEATIINGEARFQTLSGRTYTLDAATGKFLRAFVTTTEDLFAEADGHRFVAGDDLRLRCFDGLKLFWTSEPMTGQTARDYPPVIVRAAGKKFVVVRTNPVLNMAQQISNDRNFLTAQAGIDASDWKKLDAWIKSPAAAGSLELIAREQDAIVRYLETNRWAETFFVFDAATGKRAFTAPILWVGGCQGVGTPPVIARDGRAVVLYRSAYGNWNHGVAPLVALGLLDFATGRIEPLRHNHGAQPPWNTFWGTADEAQNFTLAGNDLLIAHQGTLSRFNLKTRDLQKIWGERDTYSGFRNPPWARNEWHGPARGGVAVANGRVYWITGSRLLCLGSDKQCEPVTVRTIPAATNILAAPRKPDIAELSALAEEILSKQWAPLCVEPGLGGREFFFANTSEIFIAFASAFPHLSKNTQERARKYLTSLFKDRAPFTAQAQLPLRDGNRREPFPIPSQALSRLGNDKPAHPFGGVNSTWLYAQCCGAWDDTLDRFPEIKAAFDDFQKQHPNFGAAPELNFNRHIASLLAYQKIAARVGAADESAKAAALFEAALKTLVAWWTEAGATLTTFNGSAQLDPFIGKGDKLSFAVFPHRHKIALFRDLTPELAELIRQRAPEAVEKVWRSFTNLCPAWHVVGGERQYHFGENFMDTPDLALSAYQAFAFLREASRDDLLGAVDKPFARADLYHLQKLSIALDRP